MARSHRKYCLIIKNITTDLQDPNKYRERFELEVNKLFSAEEIKLYGIIDDLVFFS